MRKEKSVSNQKTIKDRGKKYKDIGKLSGLPKLFAFYYIYFPNPDKKPGSKLTAKTKKETKKIEFGSRFD